MTHQYSAAEVRQVGAEMREQMQQKTSSEYVVKTAEHAINANRSATDTVKTLNAFQSQLAQGVPNKQVFDAIKADMAGSGSGDGSQASRSGTGTATGTGSKADRNGSGMGSAPCGR